MKSAILLLALLGSASAQAWVSTPTPEKEHHFVFRMKDETKQVQTFEYSSTAPSYNEAYERAAKACYSHFKDGKPLNEDKGLDIIDVCANPRSI